MITVQQAYGKYAGFMSFTPANCRVALLVLTYNHARYIGQCLESILQCGLESYHVWVLDDGSSDDTCAVVEAVAQQSGNITLIRQAHSGGQTSGSSQRLVDSSLGEYIVFMSGDDVLGPGFGLHRAQEALEADPALCLVIPRMVYLMQDPTLAAPPGYGADLLDLLRGGDPGRILAGHLFRQVSRIFLQGMMIRRGVVAEFGGFDTRLIADDYAFVFRLFLHLRESGGGFRFDEGSLWLYRVHGNNAHRDPVRQFQLIAQVAARYVPSEALPTFIWDGVVFRDFGQIRSARHVAEDLLGKAEARRCLAPAVRASLSAACRRGDLVLIWRILFGKRVAGRQRRHALRSLIRAVWRRLRGNM